MGLPGRRRGRESRLGQGESRPGRAHPMIRGRGADRPTIREAIPPVEIPAEEADDHPALPLGYMSLSSFLKMRTFMVPSGVT